MSYRPLRPTTTDFDLKLYTFQDVVEHVLLAFNVDSATNHWRLARAAVLEAYRAFPDEHKWSWFERRARVATEASVSTGTVEYAASTRTVTLTDATWPSDVRFKWIILNSQVYRVQSRESNTEIILSEDQSPTEDIAAGSSYTLFKPLYPLPLDYRKGGKLVSLNDFRSPLYRSSQSLLDWSESNYDPQDPPDYYTIRQSEDYMGGLCIEFSPPPSGIRTYDFYYTASPRPLTMFSSSIQYQEGSVSASGTTITGTGTSWASSMVGCVLRVSSSGTVPTGLFGYDTSDNPYDEQRVIMSVESETSLTVDQAFDGTFDAGTKYTIGAPVDVEPESMLTALQFLAEANFARLIREKDSDVRVARYINELRRAISADNRHRSTLEDRREYTDLGDLRRGS